MRKAKAVGLVVLLVTMLLAAARTHAQTIEPVDALIVVDANGKKVGSYQVDDRVGPFRVNGRGFVFLDLDKEAFAAFGFVQAYYESTDCTGTPYTIDFGQLQSAAEGRVSAPGKTLYMADFNARPKTITVRSKELFPAPCDNVYVGFPMPLDNAVPLVAVVDLNTLFTPPFHLEPVHLSECGAGSCDANGDSMVTIDELLKGVNEALNGCTAAPTPSCCQGSGTCGPPVAGVCSAGSTPMFGPVCNGATGMCEAR
jgi:hypothetical protein